MTNMPSVWFHGVQVSLKYDQYSWSSDSCELWTDFFFCKLFVRLVSPSISTIKLEYLTESQGRRQEIVGSHLHS